MNAVICQLGYILALKGTKSYVKAEVLPDTYGLSDKDPSLGKAVDGAEKRRHQNETLNVGDLGMRMTDIL